MPDTSIKLIIDAVDGHLRAHVSCNERLPGGERFTPIYSRMIANKQAAEEIALHAAAARGLWQYEVQDRTRLRGRKSTFNVG
jgi:hypothetical protein